MEPSHSSSSVIPRLPPDAAATAPRSWRHYALTALGLVVGGALGFFGMRYGLDLLAPVPHKAWKLASVAALPFAWLLVVGFHELGHLVGGWAIGGKFLLWIAGPLKIQRTPAGVRVGLNRSVNISGGLAACLPLEPAKLTPRRVAVMILGGPLASLVLTVAMLWLAVGLVGSPPPEPLPVGRALGQHLALFTAGLSLLIFVVTALPGTAGGFKTDGRRAFELLRGDARSDQEAAVMVLTTSGFAGVRPADYDPALVRRALALRDGSLFDLYAHLTVYYHAADAGRWSDAQAHLDYLLTGEAQLAPYVRAVVRCEYAWLLATQTPDAAAARAWLDAAGKLEFDPATRLRAEAAVLLAEGHRAGAAQKAREALHALEHRSLSPVKSRFASDALEALLARADGFAGRTSPAA